MGRQGDQFARDVFPVELGEIGARRKNVLAEDEGARVAPPGEGAEVPDSTRGLTGLALSGGGIRSASLSLGILQAFARVPSGRARSKRGILRFFDYLSTVSGGGCIGSTWSAAMTAEGAEPDGEEFPLRFAPGEEGKPGAVVHLRNNSNWVAPTGALDRFRLAAVVLRGILLNILLSLPALMVMVFLTEILQELRIGRPIYRVLAVLAVASFAAVILTFPMMSRLLMTNPARALGWRGRNRYELLTTVTMLVTLAAAALVPVFIVIGHARLATWEQFRLALVRTLRNPFGIGHSMGWVVLLLVVVAFLLAARAHGAVSRLSGRLGILMLGVLGPGILFGIYLLLCVVQIDSPYVGADSIAAVSVTEKQFDEIFEEFLVRLIEERAEGEQRCRARGGEGTAEGAPAAACPEEAEVLRRELMLGNTVQVLMGLTDPETGTIPVASETLCSPGFRERVQGRPRGVVGWLLDRNDPARPSTLDRLCLQVDEKLRLADRLSIEVLPGAATDLGGGRRDVWRLRTPAGESGEEPGVKPEAILRVTSFVDDQELSVSHDFEEELGSGIFSAGLRTELRTRGLLACRDQRLEVRPSPLYRHRWWIGPPCAAPDWVTPGRACEAETVPPGCAEPTSVPWRGGFYLVREGARLRFDPPQPADLFDREGGIDILFWGAFAALLVLVALVNVNLTSSHDFFRDRMSRAFLIRRRRAAGGGARGGDGIPEPCSGCGLEGCGMELVDDLKLSQLNPYRTAPYHLINATLNLEGSRDLGLRGRSAGFFVFSQRYVGGPRAGYCPTAVMEMVDTHLNLGTAMAISGAGAAPNAGYTTVRPLIFVLALLNVRLGYWLAHPGRVEESTIGRFRAGRGELDRRLDVKSGLRMLGEIQGFRAVGLSYLMREALGIVDENRLCVNLSDGGHLENLGVYELLRRRCRLIVAVDAEEDSGYGFGGLLRLVRFARIDLGIEIEIRLDELRPHCRTVDRGRSAGGEERLSERHWTVARIRYGEDEADTGYLVYVKSTLTGDESEDILDYADRNESFPQEPSSDQFYSEEQFEAYRSLGYHVGEAVGAELKALFESEGWLSESALERLWRAGGGQPESV